MIKYREETSIPAVWHIATKGETDMNLGIQELHPRNHQRLQSLPACIIEKPVRKEPMLMVL